ncbi:Proteinase inhibitor [Cardamine amara subsp. amara]|uniref:Proteinase inhibitor n=1 Tax=Cardamine amara subsp. amara TaxID=228776 RepID=A0ABD1BSP9_CARAN
MFHLPRYPPCVSGSCTDLECCAGGYKYMWPELVGETGEKAKMTIEKENPNVGVAFLRSGDRRIEDFCCNRVFVYLNSHGTVTRSPKIG